MKLLKENEFGKKYQTDKFRIYYRKKGSVDGDNAINPAEEIYLITGEAVITIDTEVRSVVAPEKIFIPEKTYHKIEALSEISFILFD